MSSEVEAGGLVAVAVIAPAAAAALAVATAAAAVYGAGWVAWQTGKLVVDMNSAVDEKIRAQKLKAKEEKRERKMMANAAHAQLVDTCSQLIKQLEAEKNKATASEKKDIEEMIAELSEICQKKLPSDTEAIENITAFGLVNVEKIVRRRKALSEMRLTIEKSGHKYDASLADMMNALSITVAAMKITAINGENVVCEPEAFERNKLNSKFEEVAAKILDALDEAGAVAEVYGLTVTANSWFESCFSGVDMLIEELCRPSTSNEELKRGITRLEEALEQYEEFAPALKNEIAKIVTLYKIYAEVAEKLAEPVESINSFKTSKELEEKLRYLEERTKKAAERAEMYQMLGAENYIARAWHEELQALGYSVHKRSEVTDMSGVKPGWAKFEDKKMPLYNWDGDDLTQLYSISEKCSLQLIVHDDGTVSMQTIAHEESEETVKVQKKHCADIKKLRENLRKNWFIMYDCEETKSPDEMTSVSTWAASEADSFKKDSLVNEQRTESEGTEIKKYLN